MSSVGYTMRMTPAQAKGIGEWIETGDDMAPIYLLNHDALKSMGLNLPANTIEVRQGDDSALVDENGSILAR